MDKDDIEKYLQMVGQELHAQELNLELLLLGGAAMLIEVGNRESTQDVDTYLLSDFAALMKAAAVVAAREGLPDGWLNSAAAGFTYGFLRQPEKTLWRTFPGLTIYLPSLEYLFVTKMMAHRLKDQADIIALASKLGIERRKEALSLVEKYVQKQHITEDVLDEIEEIFES